MVRHHVAQRAGGVVELAASLDIERLRDGDLDMVDVIAIPQRLENAVGEPKHQDVLNRLFPEIVVDPIDLALGEHAEDVAIEGLSRGQIDAERLFDDDPPPMPVLFTNEAGVSEPLHDGGEHLCGRREVEQVIAAGVMRLVGLGQKLRQILVGRRVVELALEMVEALGEPIRVAVCVASPTRAGRDPSRGGTSRYPCPSWTRRSRRTLSATALRVEDCEAPGRAGAW